MIEDADGTAYMGGSDETRETIERRMRRSLQEGRNLFIEEWTVWEPEPNTMY